MDGLQNAVVTLEIKRSTMQYNNLIRHFKFFSITTQITFLTSRIQQAGRNRNKFNKVAFALKLKGRLPQS